ncbi:MAG TPA: hypothetical protein VFU72_00940 [Nitrolancea sp.]|nr:hypothetical protein [Nitrolancea sp.]
MARRERGVMGTPHDATSDEHRPDWYEIRLQGHLGDRWAAWFDGLALTREGDGTTRLCGPVADQAALHGLLQRVRDLGLPLLAVRKVKPEQASEAAGDADTNHDAP